MSGGDAALLPVLDVLRERAGLVFGDSRRDVALTAVRRAMEAAGTDDAAAYLDRVRRGGAALDALLAEATVGETYFFRHPEQWEVLRRRALPEIVARRGDRPLRAWSAACSTGEEAYTISIVCQEEGIGAARRSIVGTDISRPRLAAAREARYGRWALRDVPAATVEAHFTRRGDEWRLNPGVREGVEFRALNLVEDDWPSPASGIGEMDLVFCRNMLIYLDRPSVRRVATRLIDALSDDGWLFPGPSDPPLADFVRCEVIVTPAGLVYRKPRPGARSSSYPPPSPAASFDPASWSAWADPAPAAPWIDPPPAAPSIEPNRPIPPPATPPRAPIASAQSSAVPPAPFADGRTRVESGDGDGDPGRLYAAREYERAAAEAGARIARGTADEGTWIVRARALANRGRLAEAEAAVATALERYRASAELHDVHALLLSGAGRAREAAAALRQALYLDPSLVVAHVRMAEVQARLGSADAARRWRRTGEWLLAAVPRDAEVPASDGMPAAHLLRTVRSRMAMLGEGAG